MTGIFLSIKRDSHRLKKTVCMCDLWKERFFRWCWVSPSQSWLFNMRIWNYIGTVYRGNWYVIMFVLYKWRTSGEILRGCCFPAWPEPQQSKVLGQRAKPQNPLLVSTKLSINPTESFVSYPGWVTHRPGMSDFDILSRIFEMLEICLRCFFGFAFPI